MEKEVDAKHMRSDQDYQARGIIARVKVIGMYNRGGITRAIYQYLTMDAGPGRDKFAVEFVSVIDGPDGFLDTSEMWEGDIIVAPGLLYRKIPWSTALMNAHLKALQSYRPKDILKADVDKSAPVIDMGEIKVNKPH